MSAQPQPEWYTSWVPGIPLNLAPGPYSGYELHPLFNFREETAKDHCAPCPDAASWPEPRDVHDLNKGLYAEVGRDWND